MDKRAFMAVAISLAIWVGWQKLYMEPIQLKAAEEAKKQQELNTASLAEAKALIDSKGIFPETMRKEVLSQNDPLVESVLENADTKLVVNNSSSPLKAWELRSFSSNLEKKEEKVHLKEITGFDSQLRLRFSDAALSERVQRTWNISSAAKANEAIAEISAPGIRAKRTISLDEKGFGATVNYQIAFINEAPKYVFLDLFGSPHRENDKEGSIFGQAPDKVHITYRDSNKRHSEMAFSHKEDIESVAGIKWVGLDTRYFVFGVVPEMSFRKDTGIQVQKDGWQGSSAIRSSLVFPTEGKQEIAFSFKTYFGPKNWESLKAVDPILTDAIDFGWTSFLAVPLLQALKWLYSYVHNYGIAIIILTFLIKMGLFPLTYKSMKSMAKMSKLQPQLNALREKYKNDKEKLNAEMMSFMKTNGYNPVGGCLPILLQMPIFFSLYRVLFNSMELYQAPFYFWIHDLSSPDHYFVTPVLLTGLMFLQQKISPSTATDPTQQKMLQFMPVMFGVFMLMLPAGLNIYMLVNSAVSIAQQWVLNKKLGITKQKTVVVKESPST